jgi:alpha,alpha-trehalose phosphorylase
MTLFHFDEAFTVAAGTSVTKQTPTLPDPGPRPTQPRTRSPRDFASALGE